MFIMDHLTDIILCENIYNFNFYVFCLSASLMSSLAHTRAGITDAMITVGALDLLIDKLYSGDDQVLPPRRLITANL